MAAPPKPRLLPIVFSRSSLRRCVPIALVVGTILSLVNQGGVILAGHATPTTWVKVVANYLIPFCVSNLGFISSQRAVWRSSLRR